MFRHSHDAIIVEFWMLGTHLGPLGKIPATGSHPPHSHDGVLRLRFDEDENLVVERIHFDQLTILKQLIGGLNKKDPRDLLRLGRAVFGLLAMSGGEPDPLLIDTLAPDLDD